MAVRAWLLAAMTLAGGGIMLADNGSPALDGRLAESLSWGSSLQRIPIAYRNDGFSTFHRQPPMTREYLEQTFIDPLAGTDVQIIEWGVGPGSVFCYDTKVGDIVGEGLTEEQWKLVRTGDRWVHDNVMALIQAGGDPLHVVAERAHALGLRAFARLEMQHEYGPADMGNWMWALLVGKLNKEHPEYRIPGTVHLDFKHREVRDFKLAILREAANAGMDGVSLDFVVYPPYFEKPDCALMTQFMRDVRAMLDEVGAAQGRRIEVMARVPYTRYMENGLDWKTWMNEGLVDIIVPSHLRSGQEFDIPIGEFVAMGKKTGCKVYPTLWHSLGFVDTDGMPQDEKTGVRRYDKPKTEGMFRAQALLFMRAGADGIQLAMAAGHEFRSRPWHLHLGDAAKVEFADKHYMVDPGPGPTARFTVPAKPPFTATARLSVRVADDIRKARRLGHTVDARLVFYCRGLQPGEQLDIFVNGKGPLRVSGDSSEERQRSDPVDLRAEQPSWTADADGSFISDAEWWKRGEHTLPFDAQWLRLGENRIRMVYSADRPDMEPLWIGWVDLLIAYDRPQQPPQSGGAVATPQDVQP